jgi:ABC-2 type transport system permease protein
MHSNLTLTLALALASFKLKYAGSVLGYLWSLVKPLLLFGMMYVVFALFLLRGRTPSGENFPVELLFGIVIWTFFADATSTSLLAIVNNGDMIKKAYFPRWILVVAAELSSLMTLLVNVALVLAVGIPLHWFTFGPQSLLLIPLFLELFVVAMGAGLLLSALYVYARDDRGHAPRDHLARHPMDVCRAGRAICGASGGGAGVAGPRRAHLRSTVAEIR